MTIDEAIRSNTVPSDFEAFKKFFELMGIKYEIPADNLIYLSGFEVNSSQLIVIKFYDDGKFQEFCPYPEEGLTEFKDLREVNKVLISECDRLIKEKGELLKKSEQLSEYKRLLKLAVEDFTVYGALKDLPTEQRVQNLDWRRFNRVFDILDHRWRYTDEALKLLGKDEANEHK